MEPKDPIKPELIKEFVTIAHKDLSKVKEMLAAEPALLNSAWDWGAGDFETALNAAGHMGRKDIADVLLTAGARMDIFCAAMLGKLDIVKTTLDAFPNLKTSKGPHGLMLLYHAKVGGEDSKGVLEYLESIGAS
ncbi:MAG: ankyrin repeat domain-containing protein [Bacteroidota bacterium]